MVDKEDPDFHGYFKKSRCATGASQIRELVAHLNVAVYGPFVVMWMVARAKHTNRLDASDRRKNHSNFDAVVDLFGGAADYEQALMTN